MNRSRIRMNLSSRRQFLAQGTAVAAAVALPGVVSAQGRPVLKAGDQKGGLRALLEAAGGLEGLGYDIQWSEFPAAAPLVWAALSVYYSTQANQLKVTARPEPGDARELCPVCHQAPVASVVRIGDKAGLRYLHCTLCESEWHYVRAQCSACESSRDIGLWTLDDVRAAVRAETCGECNSYLKLMALDIDHQLEPVADDLATLALDAAVEEQGYARSAINPFLFPAH